MMAQLLPDLTGRLNDLGATDPNETIRLGLLGGTFDPIHMGHLRIAEEVREQLDLAGVLFIPTGNPVFKKDRVVTNAHTRLAQVVRATAQNPHFGVSSFEIDRPGDTFTIDTLRALRACYPENVSFYFIVGSDAAASLPHWRDASQLAQLATFVLAGDRPGEESQERVLASLVQAADGFTLEYVPVRALDISSSEIRELAKQRRSIRYLVPECIRCEVQEHFASETAAFQSERRNTLIEAMSDEFYEARKEDLRKRVSEKRFQHSLGVAQTAVELAHAYDLDVSKARLAGILHDWDKGYNDEGIRLRVQELELADAIDPEVVTDMPATLHGMTAACALAREYPEIPEDIIQAIARHTIADENMQPLDMVLYIADALEPGRRYGEVDELRELIGKIELEDLFFKVFHYWISVLLARERTLYPDTIRVWNAYAKRLHPREGFTGHDCRS